jgi:transcriptional regulator with XRE-family HTH domain
MCKASAVPQETTFATRLTRLMNDRRLTVPEFHRELSGAVSQRTIFRWRSGDAVPGIEALPMLARALETTPDFLVGWREEA